MKPLSIFLLDDNAVFLQGFQQHLSEYLKQNAADAFTTAHFSDVPSMLEAAKTVPVDLVIADIDLGANAPSGIDGVAELLKLWPDCAVIYLTAFLSYATDIYETAPIYYILKEEYTDRLPQAMKRFFQYRSEQTQYVSILSCASRVIVPLKQLVYCERFGRSVQLNLSDGQEIRTSMSIKEIYDLLPKRQFSICHRGYIVNHHFISATKRLEITLSTGKTLPVGRSCCDTFRENYHHWLANYL